jgi:hypothetical protein
MTPSIAKTVAHRIASLKMDILKEASPILLGLFTIMFGLHADYAIARTMSEIVPAGVGHFSSDTLPVAVWRVISMVACALFICILFVHASIAVIKMRLQGSMIAIYVKAFFAFYLALSPWVTLHLARLVGAVLLREISIGVDILFVAMYAAGGMVLWSLVRTLDLWQLRKTKLLRPS